MIFHTHLSSIHYNDNEMSKFDSAHYVQILNSYSLENLKKECKNRGLPVSGTKVKLTDRLIEYDELSDKGNKSEKRDDYKEYSLADLKKECKKRGLPVSGTKAQLRERIEDDDEQSDEGTESDDEQSDEGTESGEEDEQSESESEDEEETKTSLTAAELKKLNEDIFKGFMNDAIFFFRDVHHYSDNNTFNSTIFKSMYTKGIKDVIRDYIDDTISDEGVKELLKTWKGRPLLVFEHIHNRMQFDAKDIEKCYP